jgi:hypothetical protein
VTSRLPHILDICSQLAVRLTPLSAGRLPFTLRNIPRTRVLQRLGRPKSKLNHSITSSGAKAAAFRTVAGCLTQLSYRVLPSRPEARKSLLQADMSVGRAQSSHRKQSFQAKSFCTRWRGGNVNSDVTFPSFDTPEPIAIGMPFQRFLGQR